MHRTRVMPPILPHPVQPRQDRPTLAVSTMPNALIHGTGLIGASIGLGLRSAGWRVVGWDPDPAALDVAMRRGAIAAAAHGPDDGTSDTDLLLLAGPPSATVASLSFLDTPALVTDVAGVKSGVVTAASDLPRFVGGHPMAGGASSGAALASSHLFHGATWVLTTDGARDQDLEVMEGVVRSLGANPSRMTAADHDAAVARISHLPHILAAALMSVAGQDEQTIKLAGGGFRDLTRIAAADPDWWVEVLTANRVDLGRVISDLEAELARWKSRLEGGDPAPVAEALSLASRARTTLGEHHSQVKVVLYDRPGEIAGVGHALEASGANVRDFQLRHGEHGGGGILTISVTPATADRLREALEAEGFTVEE